MANGIHPNFLKEIPDFIIDSMIVHCDSLIFKKDEKSLFLLARNLIFYEFRNKQLRHCLDLNETCLKNLEVEIKLEADANNAHVSQTSAKTTNPAPIKIGKYIYRNFEVNKLYLLLQCWDKLIIMEHSSTNGLKLSAEFENVLSFKIIPNMLIKYQSELSIQFTDGSNTCTDFQEDPCNTATDVGNNGCKAAQKNEFKHLLDKVRTTKAELQLHKEITQKQFQSHVNVQNFGNNFLRSTRLEEKSIMSKCGDVWMRITASDELVLGVPLVNNCAPPNLTTLKNLQPILSINKEKLQISTKAYNNKTVNFEHKFYQLHQTFENLETLESLFQTQDANFQWGNAWKRATTNALQPSSFIVLLLKFKISQIISINAPCQLFVRFEVEKDLETLEPKTQKFEQHLFIKSLDFQHVLHQRSMYDISFHEHTLHQDLLAVAMVSVDTKLRIEFTAQNDFESFERLLAAKFDFNIIHRTIKSSSSCDDTATMDVDDGPTNKLTDTLYYNRQPNSLWFGSLILRSAINEANATFENDEESFSTDWIFYNKSEEKSFLMMKFLFDDLISLKCNVKSVKILKYQRDCGSHLILLENAIREELKAFSELHYIENDQQNFHEKFKRLAECQLHTDQMAEEL